MSILIPVKSKSRFFNEEILIYILCVLSYFLLLSVVFRYYETVKDDFFKPDKILLCLLYTGELLFVFLFSPIFALKQITANGNKSTKIQPINVHMQTLPYKKFFFKIIIKAFVLICIFHVISLFSIYNNSFFSLPRFFMMVILFFVCSLFITAYTSFLIVITRNIFFTIAATYITIIGILGCVFFISPLLDLVGNPTSVINLTLNINPMMAIASILNFDLLRWGPFYESAQIGMFRFSYPHWSVHVLSYLALSVLFFAGSFILRNLHIKSSKKEGRLII
jgi:hypothetical protein